MDFLDLTDGPDSRTFNPGEVAGRAVRALGGNDTVAGSVDNEDINGNLGDDIISGGGGDDFLRGGQGNDTVLGGDGNDTVNGNLGNDIVDGGEGNDVVRGGQGDDVLTGANGDDTLFGDLGFDTLIGGDGADTFVLQGGKGQDTIVDFTVGTDRLFLEGLTTGDLTLTDSNGSTIITDSVTGQVAVVQGVASNAIANVLGIPTANPSDRLPLGASSTSGAGGGTPPTISPFNSNWSTSSHPNPDSPGNNGWVANGSLEIINGAISFQVNASDVVVLRIPSWHFGDPGFAQVNFDFFPQSFPTIISIPIVPNALFGAANLNIN